MLYLFLICLALAGLNIVQVILHYHEKKELFDRYMAGDYRAYNYYTKEYPIELKDKEKALEKERGRVLSDEEIAEREAAEGF
jgi:hypothetical protein